LTQHTSYEQIIQFEKTSSDRNISSVVARPRTKDGCSRVDKGAAGKV